MKEIAILINFIAVAYIMVCNLFSEVNLLLAVVLMLMNIYWRLDKN